MTNPFPYEELPAGPEQMLAMQYFRLADHIIRTVPESNQSHLALSYLMEAYRFCRVACGFEV